MQMKKFFLWMSIVLFVFEVAAQKQLTREQYIEKYNALAVDAMAKYGIPASITLAQGILESSNGNSFLAKKANNHFGIKKHDWTGPTVKRDDDRKNEEFRKYDYPGQSYADHAQFLTKRGRYEFLFDLNLTDYKGWARGLKSAGYATDPRYAGHLIRIIEENELYMFDRGVKVQFSSSEQIASAKERRKVQNVDRFVIEPYALHQIYSNNKVKYVKVKPGDSFQGISQELELRDWELFRYNDLKEDAELRPGQLLYIQPKRFRAKEATFHLVEAGETMYGISQRYGLKLKYLYRLNRMRKGEAVEVGDKVHLNKRKPKS